MREEQYKVTVGYMNGKVTQEIVWAVNKRQAKEIVQMNLPETVEIYKIGVDTLTEREIENMQTNKKHTMIGKGESQ